MHVRQTSRCLSVFPLSTSAATLLCAVMWSTVISTHVAADTPIAEKENPEGKDISKTIYIVMTQNHSFMPHMSQSLVSFYLMIY